jgi:hypothetical protein
LEYIIVHGEDSGAEVMGLIREKFKKTKTTRILNLTFLFREQAVLEAEIRAVKHSSTWFDRVNAYIQVGAFLTEASHRPTILASTRNFVSSNHAFAARSGTNIDEPMRALVVGWATRKGYIVYFMGVIILLSVAAEMLVGFLAHSASLGLTVSSGLGTVLSCVEILVCWHFR